MLIEIIVVIAIIYWEIKVYKLIVSPHIFYLDVQKTYGIILNLIKTS